MNSDQPSRDEIETRLTALLLGELPTDEAALLRYTMAQDPALQQLHDELQATLVLVREAAKHPAEALVEKNAPLKLQLSAERRQQLLAQFKSPRPKAPPQPLFWLKRIEMPRLVPVLVAVACLAVLAAMLLPSLAAAKRKGQSRGQYGAHEFSVQETLGSLSDLAGKILPANHASEQALSASPAPAQTVRYQNLATSAPASPPEAVTLAPEPQLAPPPVPIILPQVESAPEIAAQAGEPAETGKGGVYSQQIVGYVNIPAGAVALNAPLTTSDASLPTAPAPAPGGSASPQVEADSSQLASYKGNRIETVDKLDRKAHPENQWTVPAQAREVPENIVASGTGGGGGFGGGGSGGGGGGGFGGGRVGGVLRGYYDDAYGNKVGTPTPQTAGSASDGTAAPLPAKPSQTTGTRLSSTHAIEEQHLPGVSEAAAEDAAYERSLVAVQRKLEGKDVKRSGNFEGFFSPVQPGAEKKEGTATASPLAWTGSASQSSAVPPATGGTTYDYRVPTGVAAEPAQESPVITPNGVLPILSKDQKLFTVKGAKSDGTYQLSADALPQAGSAGSAGNRFYRNPAQASEQKKVPLLGDVAALGAQFQGSLNDNVLVPKGTPAPAVDVARVAAPAAAFAFNAGAPTVRSSQLSSSSQNSPLQQRSMNANTTMNNNGTTVTFDTAPALNAAGNTVGVASDSFNTEVTKEEQPLLGIAAGGSLNLAGENKLSDAERTRELQPPPAHHQNTGLYLPQSADGATEPAWVGVLDNPQPGQGQTSGFGGRENGNHFVSRYAATAPISAGLDQPQITDALRQKSRAAGGDLYATSPSPTMDAQQLQMINSQRVGQEKVLHEQSAQLQELKAIEKSNKEKLAEVLPQIVQDATLNDLLSKRQEAKSKLATQTKDPAATDTTVTRSRAELGELNREIADRESGVMAGLESKVNATKAALEAMSASVEEAKRKDQQEAQKNQPYYDAKRNLEQKLETHKLLYSKLGVEKVDQSLPEMSMVQITDPAQPGHSQNFWQRLTGQVESTARVKVENDVTDIPGLGNTPTMPSFDPYFIQTTFEIMKSEAVLGKVVDDLNLQSAWASKNGGEKLTKSEAVAQLKQRLDLQPVKNTKLIEIGAKSDDPKEAADIANAVAKAYAQYRAESRRQLTTNGVAFLEDQFAQQEKEIRLAQVELDRLGKDLAPQQNQPEPAPVPSDLPLRKPAPNAPVPQPEILARDNNFSTFSLNVSDVSFKFAEASLQNGKLPDTAAIRSEEFINAFDYRDPEAAAGQPMAFASERARYPFAHNRELLRFAVKTAAAGRPAGRALNLVLLLDNSGSMERADRVAIIRESLRVLATQLQPQDTVSVVTFARTARLWADGLSGDKAGATLDQVGGITPEGGTNLEEAMRLAYETAHRHYLPNGLNRVVLLTDGAANLGNVEPEALKQKVEAQRKQGIALDCFGIGWEDYNDDLLEQLSSNGDGRYAFLNSPEDASKDFAAKLAGALQIAAADVKVQVEFNPGRVISYRQIGYARHQLTKEQFRDNTVAAGEIAAQEAGNALYTIETNPNGDGPIATVHVRYRIPGTSDYREHTWEVAYTGSAPALDQSSPAMRLAATASAFSEWLAASPYAQAVTLDELLKDLRGVPDVYGADDRPKQLETMIREAKSLEGK